MHDKPDEQPKVATHFALEHPALEGGGMQAIQFDCPTFNPKVLGLPVAYDKDSTLTEFMVKHLSERLTKRLEETCGTGQAPGTMFLDACPTTDLHVDVKESDSGSVLELLRKWRESLEPYQKPELEFSEEFIEMVKEQTGADLTGMKLLSWDISAPNDPNTVNLVIGP